MMDRPRLRAGALVILAGAVMLGCYGALRLRREQIFRLPAPTGSFLVGTSALTLANEIAVQIWYPAATTSGARRAPYLLARQRASMLMRLRSLVVGTSASIDAPVAAGRHPVLIYIPGWGGVRSDNTIQAQNLASHGFIVVAMDDLYPDQPMEMTSERTYRRTLAWAAKKTRLQAAAALRVFDTLSELDAGSGEGRFADRLDLQHTGMFGFSFGGAVAAEAATLDRRIRAVANLDGWIFSDAAERGVLAPFFIFSTRDDDSAAPSSGDPEGRFVAELDRTNVQQIIHGFRKHGGYLLTIDGTDHFNFTDTPFLPSVRHRGVGPIDRQRASSIISAYLAQFFGRYLVGIDAPLLKAQDPAPTDRAIGSTLDPVARLEIWNAPPRPPSRPRAFITTNRNPRKTLTSILPRTT